jgi:hypothetical protein
VPPSVWSGQHRLYLTAAPLEATKDALDVAAGKA